MHGYVPPQSEIDRAAAKAVDDYLLMERKARAWDRLCVLATREELRRMEEVLAQTGAPDTLKRHRRSP